MNGEIADMVFTDPPYNVNYEPKSGLSIENDNMESDDFYNFLYDFYIAALDHTKEGGAIYVCHADSEGENFRKALTNSGWLLKQGIIWVKNQLVFGRQDYQWKHEPILYGWKPGAAHYWNGDRKQTTVIQDSPQVKVKEKGELFELHFDTGIHTVVMRVPSYDILSSGDDTDKSIWYFDKPVKSVEHPTMKPIGIPGRAIKNSSKKDEIVLDPFGGSGSTLIAAEQTGRIAYLNELDPKYVDVIVKRYIEFKNNDSDVFLIRDEEKIPYKDLI
jgi:DNA modification methylase